MPADSRVPAATSTVVPGNSRLRKANYSPKAVTNMTSAAQSECDLMKSSSGWATSSMNSVAAGPGRPSAIYAGAIVAAQGTDFPRDDMIGRELIPPREEPGLGYAETVGGTRYVFADLKTLLARATPPRSGDRLAGLEAADMTERVAAQLALADLPLRRLIEDPVLPYETDEITRLIIDSHDRDAFVPIAAMTVGELRNWLLSDAVDTPALAHIVAGLTPEIAAAVSKIMRLQDLISVAAKCRVVTRFRDTIGLEGRLATRLQPNHPTDDPRGIAASVVDGLMYASGDAVIGVNPASDDLTTVETLLRLLDRIRETLNISTQTCVLAHVTTQMEAMRRRAPVDLVFQSIAGTEAANRAFGVSLPMLEEAREQALALARGTVGQNVMYFETGQGSAVSANAHHGIDQMTC